MEEEVLKSIDNKLSAIIRLIAGASIKGKNKTDSIITLASFGVDIETIANIVDTTPKIIRTRLWEAKAASKKGKKKSKKKEKEE